VSLTNAAEVVRHGLIVDTAKLRWTCTANGFLHPRPLCLPMRSRTMQPARVVPPSSRGRCQVRSHFAHRSRDAWQRSRTSAHSGQSRSYFAGRSTGSRYCALSSYRFTAGTGAIRGHRRGPGPRPWPASRVCPARRVSACGSALVRGCHLSPKRRMGTPGAGGGVPSGARGTRRRRRRHC
jgi:hypothetical protein